MVKKSNAGRDSYMKMISGNIIHTPNQKTKNIVYTHALCIYTLNKQLNLTQIHFVRST